MFSFLLVRFLGVELLSCMVSFCVTFQETAKNFPECTKLQSHQQCTRVTITPGSHQMLCSVFLDYSRPGGVKCSHCGFDLHFARD